MVFVRSGDFKRDFGGFRFCGWKMGLVKVFIVEIDSLVKKEFEGGMMNNLFLVGFLSGDKRELEK